MKLMSALSLLRKNGIVWCVKFSWHRLIDNYYEIYFGVNTKGSVQ